jgi:hypothetical protein
MLEYCFPDAESCTQLRMRLEIGHHISARDLLHQLHCMRNVPHFVAVYSMAPRAYTREG